MHHLFNWFIRNPVAANLLMVVILVSGMLSIWNIRIEGFPKIPADTISVTINDVGLSAVDVDRSITRPVERHLDSLKGAHSISSLSIDGQSVVSVRKNEGAELRRLLDDIKVRMDSLANIPTSAERPVIEEVDQSYSAMIVQIYGGLGGDEITGIDADLAEKPSDESSLRAYQAALDSDQKELQRTARIIKQRLLAHPDIADISQWGERSVEISIEVDRHTLRNFDMTLDDVANVVNRGSIIQRDGELKTSGGSIQIRTSQQSLDVGEFSALPIKISDSGAVVLLGDIATISETFADDDVQVRFRGEPAIGFEVFIDSNGNLLETNRAVNSVISESYDVLSNSIKADVWANQTGFVSDRLATLRQNAWQGLLLVFVILACFLSVKLAFWVAVGIPVCLAGTLAVMTSSYFGYSLNDITTFGIIIVLGILVDDAIVVGESVFTSQAEHEDPIEGTALGVKRVATATIFGVLTTMAAFIPMTLFQDPLGIVFGSFAVVVIIALAFSLVESKLILPSHLVPRYSRSQVNARSIRKSIPGILPRFFGGLLLGFRDRVYKPVLVFSLRFHWQVLVVFVTIFYVGYGLVSIGVVRTLFFPAIPTSVVTVAMEFDGRMPREATRENTKRLAEIADTLNAELIEQYGFNEPPISTLMTAVVGPSNAAIYAELSTAGERTIDALEISRLWRERAGVPEGVVKIEFLASEETASGFMLEIFAEDRELLNESLANTIRGLEQIQGVSDVRSNFETGKSDVSINLTATGIALGLDAESLTRQISSVYGGVEVQRHQNDEGEVKVFVRYPLEQRDSLSDLMEDYVRLPHGEWVPLSSVAQFEFGYVPSWLWRKDNRLGATITAHIDKSLVSSPDVYAQLQSGGLRRYLDSQPGVEIVPAGEIAQEEELSNRLWVAFFLACLMIYVLLAVPLKSYFQPLIILSVLPFGFVGAAVGHYVMDIPFSVLSFFGMLALSGIIVNDSLILVISFNDEVAQGNDNPVVAAATSRFRAVFLTTITTVAGLMPILLQSSEQAQYLIPAAVSLVFGELFATVITLILVPLLIAIGESGKISRQDGVWEGADDTLEQQVAEPARVSENPP